MNWNCGQDRMEFFTMIIFLVKAQDKQPHDWLEYCYTFETPVFKVVVEVASGVTEDHGQCC